jgi:hypothetical protein
VANDSVNESPPTKTQKVRPMIEEQRQWRKNKNGTLGKRGTSAAIVILGKITLILLYLIYL